MSLLDELHWFPGGAALVRQIAPVVVGNSAAEVASAVGTLSGAGLRAVPASGDWTTSKLERLLAGVHQLPRVAVIADVAAGEFGARDTPDRAFLDYLEGGLPPMWSSREQVGPFVLLDGTLTGQGGTVVSIVDAYPTQGRRGVHLQVIERLTAALRREGSAPGGLLLVVPTEHADNAADLITTAGLHTELWDTDSPG